jgi:flagellin
MTALQSLAQTENDLNTTQSSDFDWFACGGSASDNAAYWSISTTMRSDNGALSTVHDSLNLGDATVGVADTALTSVISVMNQIKDDLVSAAEPGVDKGKVQTDITALQAQLSSIATSASFNGINWLSQNSASTGYNPTADVVSSFSRDSREHHGRHDRHRYVGNQALRRERPTGILDSVKFDDRARASANMNIRVADDDTADQTTLSNLTSQVDAAIQSITSAASTLGATKTRIDIQSTFVSSLSDSITSGVGSLVDADMNEASTRLQALQTQQQLGVQSLSIANQQTALILKLFGL